VSTVRRATLSGAPVFGRSTDDDTLCIRLARDLDGTFEALVLAHQDRLYTIALRILGDARDAEEVAQDAFVRAYRAIAGYDAGRIRELKLRGWLTAIAVNLARNRATRRRQPPSVPLDAADGRATVADMLPATEPSSSPDGVALRNEEVRHWAALLGALPDRYRIPVVLRHVDGLSFPEMSAALDRPEGTLKAQVHRGLNLLRLAHLGHRDNTAPAAGHALEPMEVSA
jgi:RNA polymerase sigma-70 factor (ECF subfamily)